MSGILLRSGYRQEFMQEGWGRGKEMFVYDYKSIAGKFYIHTIEKVYRS